MMSGVKSGVLGELRVLNAVANGLRDETKPWHRLVKSAEKRTGVDRLKLFATLLGLLAVYLSTSGPGTGLLSDAIAFLYPAYVTMVAVTRETHRPPGFGRLSVRRKWLTYWMTFVALLSVERLIGGFLRRVVPYYCLIRTVFLVWCYAPTKSNGAAFIYAAVVRRLVAPRLATPYTAITKNTDGRKRRRSLKLKAN